MVGINPFIASLAGVVLGVVLSGLGQWLRDCKRDSDEVKSVTHALCTEVDQIVHSLENGRYLENARQTLNRLKADPTEEVPFGLHLHQDYFVVYHGLVSSLGRLQPPLAADIVAFYTKAKTLIDVTYPHRDAPWSTDAEKIASYEQFIVSLEKIFELGASIKIKSPEPRRCGGWP